MRRFRVIDGSADTSLTAPLGGAAPADPVNAPVVETTEQASPDPAIAPGPATDGVPADGLVTARKGYDAALQTTRKIRQRSLLDFLR